MLIKKQLLQLINDEFNLFQKLDYNHKIVPNSIPIVWFGNVEKYFDSKVKIITVSLNPSDKEFKNEKSPIPSTKIRFPDYNGSLDSVYSAYNNYFLTNPYNRWFKSSFEAVLKSFNASYYENEQYVALHTDIGSSYATDPTWSGLDAEKTVLEPIGSESWHKLVKILEPDIILFSASENFEKKIIFPQVGNWSSIDVKAKRPLLKGTFKVSSHKHSVVLFQVQGRMPFLQTSKEEKFKFKEHI